MVFFITVIYLYPLFLWIFVIILSLNTCIKLQCKFSHIINVNTIKKARCNITNIYILVYILHKLYAFIIDRLLPSVWFRFRVFIRERDIFHFFFRHRVYSAQPPTCSFNTCTPILPTTYLLSDENKRFTQFLQTVDIYGVVVHVCNMAVVLGDKRAPPLCNFAKKFVSFV